MAGISGFTNNFYYGTSTSSVGTLFGSLKKDSSSAMTSVLSDYASLKNGSYGKLLKSYYAENSSDDSGRKASSVDKPKTKTVDAETKNTLSDIKSSASSLKTASERLSSFDKLEKDDVYDAVKDFADKYNDTVDAAAKTNKSSVAKVSDTMSSMTNTMKNALGKVGISVGNDGRMTVDEDALKAADTKSIRSLFNRSSSYGGQIGKYAASMASASANALTSLTSSTYSGTGSYASDMLSGSGFNSYF